MFARWGAAVHRARWTVLITMLVLAIVGGGWGLGVFDRLTQGGYDDPNSEASEAGEIAADALDGQAGDVVIMYTVPDGQTLDDPELASAVNDHLASLPEAQVESAISYWQTGLPQFASEDGDVGLAVLGLVGEDSDEKLTAYEEIADDLTLDGVETQVAGAVVAEHTIGIRAEEDIIAAEIVSLPIVLVLLVVIFGGLVAASLPVIVGGLAVFGSLGVLNLIAQFTTVNVFAVNVASMLGLGLAIDYGLFVVGRFREEREAGRDTSDSVRRSVATAGRTVAFSAVLLVIALSGLMLFPQEFLRSLAYGGMSAVAMAAVMSLTVLPAMLALLGHRVDKLSLPFLKRRQGRDTGAGWRRLANGVMKRPGLIALPITAGLILLGSPFLNTQYGMPDERVLPADDPARVATEALKADFPAMGGDGIQVVLQGDGAPPAEAEIGAYLAELGQVNGIESAAPAGAAGEVVVLEAQVDSDPFGDTANQAVRDIRALDAPTDTEVLVGGITAANLDSLDATAEMLPWMALLLVGATLILIFLAFGSVLLPIKAVIMSALSLSATFGVLTWLFVDGHGSGLLGVTPMPMEAGIVVLIAAIVFGLSTDYEVFLLSRMVEARANGATTEEAVRTGLVRTGRVISAAALLLVVVTGAFAFSGIQMMRFIGVGMIIALILDATIVRMLLVPAVMKLLGDAVWWAPGPLKRLQERVGLSEVEKPEEAEAETASAGAGSR
ncbi:MMPL family transporter [Actinoalloteichus hymeniacidonis]|uniref:RND superfamily drug exporter n=1 Tax=Actinoalloteichus hymeniacidonis TaxID=340345 RepID=A0AAC9N1H6_9PSEU|nr:MMPL family transporter [Actinoalloteichus hymeniacidonis]AOS66167.1 putative RND superfamily drug exporter [Actinoalloteichus hymeniacidonis]MBB5905730.1 RND superfamily putative drug exporter [Actinoalloteichus hymeniacidonis]